MTDADMTRPAADDHPKDLDHTPAVEPRSTGGEDEPSEHEQGDHEATQIKQTGGKIANPYME
jgi:hypothetical protein